MKNMKVFAATAVLAVAGFMGEATAQTCAAPTAFNTPAAGPVASGTTCGGTDSVAQYCGGIDSAGKPDAIYQVTLAAAGPNRTATIITIGGGAAGFTPSAFLYSAGCGTGDNCVGSGDTTTTMDLSGAGAGTYFLGVSAANFDASGACGAYTLTANGTLPVALQTFSVE